MCIRIGNHEYDPNYFTQSFINHSLSMTEGNLVTSPFGVFFMLCALLGSGGPRKNTSLEIGNAVLGKYVHHHNDNNDWESIASDTLWLYRSTLDSLSAEMTYVDNEWSQVITLANGIYASDDLQINGDFEQLLTEYFDENIHRVNFTDQSTAMQTINQWISSKTNNLISQFFNHPHEILPNSLLNLFSIFYFKDVWEVQFMEMFTENATFEVSSDRQIQVPIMFNEEELGYADFKSEGFEMISKSFKNTRFTFIVILPKEKKSNLNLLSQFLMGNQSLQNYIQQLKSERVSLKLPKFKLESILDLENILKLHGIHDLFDPIKANLSD
ncbi:unnamed protein product [Schistosoma rodhaini]|nr:unnamed protein product [Schistosoma rodhaini]